LTITILLVRERFQEIHRMFRFSKTLPVVSLFHNAKSQASLSVLKYLRDAKIKLEKEAGHPPFDLEVTEEQPTPDQLRSIVNIAGAAAQDQQHGVQRPCTVDWENGRVILGENVSKLQQMVEELKKQQ